ncbi:MAG: hypothetical protein JWR77_862 [Rhizorhabdus sp.]|nr:hypothetical protein [Rhizorhabdus sp.]
MSRLLNLMLLLGLFVAMMGGAMVHAAETPGGGEVTAATSWQHSDGDHDQVPADADKDYPHHHAICHGHDLAVLMKVCAAPPAGDAAGLLRPSADAVPAPAAPGSPLRPPIA